MARELLNLQVPQSAGITPAYSTPTSDGFAFSNDGHTILHVKNGSGGALTVTLITPTSYDGNTVADKTVAIPAGQERMIGGLNPTVYNQPENTANAGRVFVDFSTQASISVAAFRG